MASGLFSEQTCPRCGTKTRHDAVACPACGYWLRPANYLPVLVVVILAAVLDIGLIVWRGVPRSALPISASELPPAIVVSVPPPTIEPDAAVAEMVTPASLPPTRTPIPTATMPPTATTVPTATRTATATATPTPTSTATSIAPTPTPTTRPVQTMPANQANAAAVPPTAAPFTGGPADDGSVMPDGTPTAAASTPTRAPTATAAPTSTPTEAPNEGSLLLHNYIGAELVVTVTSQDAVWATTFRIDAMGQTTVSLAPGRYTYTASPAGKPDQHGELSVAAGATVEVSVVG